MAVPNPYHLSDMEQDFQTIEIYDADGNRIDPDAVKLDPDWYDWMFGDDENYKPLRTDDEEIGDAITANNCGIGPEGFEAGNSCAKGGEGISLVDRTFYHSTDAKSAKVLESEGVDKDALNTRDSGFFGRGMYSSVEPQDFYGKSIVAVTLKPDAKILDVGDLRPKEPQPWHNEFISSLTRRIKARRPDYPDDKLQDFIDTVTPGTPKFRHLEYAREVGSFARSEGYHASKFANGQETVIHDTDAIESIKRVGNLSKAKSHKSQLDVTRNEQPQDTGKFEADDDDIHFIDEE